ncbi:thiol:disulfide interchange protein DsbC [Geobacter sp. OR-1]|uniref:disulfide isomerase DsbC N-terminal domain-containing protein n=1 Tax=Geobacter sp. OR-1 TaxID=1266765 RepID=UPI0005423272|nr:disulfide isomerase DsbC N-terminal domain-containing protein [Geobacter sp. OR-1]GAM11180.1 thiol:disulfide interchange protein DsbC [Geobacter sp. OR-1]
MKISKLLRVNALSLFAGMLFSISIVHAEDSELVKVRESFVAAWPDVNIQGVNRTAIKGLYEVVTEERVMYYLPKTDHVIAGRMYDKNGTDLSALAIEKAAAERFTQLAKSKDKAIKVGTGPIEVIEVINLDCAYCRQMERFWKKRTDVTRYVFLDTGSADTESIQKAKLVLAAKDRSKALFEALSGKYDFSDEMPAQINDNGLQALHQQLVGEAAISGTPVYLIKGRFVNGAEVDKIEDILCDNDETKVLPTTQ